MEIVESVVPIKIPPPISIVIEVALAEITAPAKEINGGIMASHFLSRTSDNLPTIGDRTLCIRRGPYGMTSIRCFELEVLQTNYLDDPSCNCTITKISDDESNYGAGCYNDKNLCHDAGR
jgi:hypothetical protein